MAGKLTARFAATVKKPGRHGDGNGLYLMVKPGGSKSWVLRTFVRGRRCDMGLGGYPMVPLAEARAAAFENRKLARAGGDPLALRRRPDIPAFEEAARTVIAMHKPTWRNGGRSAGQWESSLRQYAFPRLGARGVDTITTADVMAVLLPIWTEKAETARRVRQRISAIMKWAVAQGYRRGYTGISGRVLARTPRRNRCPEPNKLLTPCRVRSTWRMQLAPSRPIRPPSAYRHSNLLCQSVATTG